MIGVPLMPAGCFAGGGESATTTTRLSWRSLQVMPALAEMISEDELAAVNAEPLGSISPADMDVYLRLIQFADNPEDQQRLLEHMENDSPPKRPPVWSPWPDRSVRCSCLHRGVCEVVCQIRSRSAVHGGTLRHSDRPKLTTRRSQVDLVRLPTASGDSRRFEAMGRR